MAAIHDLRIRACNGRAPREDGDFVLYWMTAFRRLGWNFALERAAEAARRWAKPLVILEPLRCGYRWANDRIHRFVIDGMADHAARGLAGPLPPRLKVLPAGVRRRWPAASPEMLAGGSLAALAIDHSVPPVAGVKGGDATAEATLERFLDERLERYGERNDPGAEVTSGLSPHLHFGSISSHQIFSALAARERWTPERLGRGASGAKEGWWGMGPAAEKFLDEAVTWREVGYNMASHREDFERYESLPDWARATLAKHERDPRPHLYPPEELDAGATHDPLWNAAQGQLREEGRIHNYLKVGEYIARYGRNAAQTSFL